jgi:hypothetical protein
VKRPSPRVGIGAPPRAPVLAAVALSGILALSGCQVMSPIQTDVPYQPADGVAVDLGDVQVRDLVVVSAAKGDAGILSGMVINNGTETVTVTFAVRATDANGAATDTTGISAQADIPAGTAIRLSGVDGTTPVTLTSIATAPGGILGITVSTPAGGAPEVSVPVLLPTGYYAAITPAPAPTTTTPTPAPTTSPAPAPAPTTTPTPGPTTTPTP